MKKKKEKYYSVSKIFIIVVMLFLCFDSYIILNFIQKDNHSKKGSDMPVESNNSVNKVLENSINEVKKITYYGKYIIKSDKNSFLVLNEDGSYFLNVNRCDGYIALEGSFYVRDKKLILDNKNYISDIDNLNNNSEIALTIEKENTIKLDEDIACLYQGVLFEKNI